MLSIRLSRVGKKHQPSYRLIVLDKRKDPWGDYLELLGFYNPMVKPKVVQFKAERIKHWLSQGAQPTDTVWNLLVDQELVEGPKRKKHAASKKAAAPEPKPEDKTETQPASASAETAPAVENPPETPGIEPPPAENPAR